MRTIPTSKLTTPTATTTILAPTATATRFSVAKAHSTIPYLFGGLAALMGLIAFALLMLACSHWKLFHNNDNENIENKETEESENKESVAVYEEKILVIMAGDEKPTFLATPACHKCSCSCLANGVSDGDSSDKRLEDPEDCDDKFEKENEGSQSREQH